MEIYRSARKHGVDDEAIVHAIEHAIVVVDLEPDADPPRILAMGLRPLLYALLPGGEDDE